MRMLETDPSASADLAPLIGLRDLDALASMVITALPFLPLPLMVLRGADAADAADAMASSFDLLKQEIILQRVTGTHRSQEQIVQDKTSLLRALQEEMHRHCSSGAASDSSEWVEDAYFIYCKHFRLYFVENYPTCSRDMRFEPMANVSKAHVIMQQAASHAHASLILVGA
jgi:hypothetical protein